MTWIALSEQEKKDVIEYCNLHLNKEKPDAFCETGEPMYFDQKGNLQDISEVIEGIWTLGAEHQ